MQTSRARTRTYAEGWRYTFIGDPASLNRLWIDFPNSSLRQTLWNHGGSCVTGGAYKFRTQSATRRAEKLQSRRKSAEMSAYEFESLEASLEAHLPEAELREVKRLLFGKDTQ